MSFDTTKHREMRTYGLCRSLNYPLKSHKSADRVNVKASSTYGTTRINAYKIIEETLFDAFNEFELDDLSFFNEVDRHYEKSEVTEAALNRRAAKPQESVEETVSQRMEVDKLHQAIAKLPEKQRRRLVLYYFGEFTYEQIADMEGCKYQTVQDSIYAALKNLKKFLA